MGHMNVIAILIVSLMLSGVAQAWNKPGHMLSASIAFQVLRQESPGTINSVRTVLTNHPWFTDRWQPRLNQVSASEHERLLFMTAARWADDARGTSFHRANWHYINIPFKPAGEPDHVQADPAKSPNILTALAAAENVVRTDSDQGKRAVALAWIFHLVGDIHQPLHSTALFTHEYPDGDRGGNEICIRPTPNSAKMNLHKFWDDLMARTENYVQLRNFGTALRSRPDLAKANLTELGPTDFQTWLNESFEKGVAIGYANGNFRGTPKGHADECTNLTAVTVLPTGYIGAAKHVADRRMVIAGYRLAELLKRMLGN